MSNNLTISTSIKSYPDEKYNLSALLDDKGACTMCWLSFKIHNGLHKEDKCWDNDEYLSEKLLPLLQKFKTDKWSLSLEDLSKLKELTQEGLPEEDFPIVLEMLEKGVELGMLK